MTHLPWRKPLIAWLADPLLRERLGAAARDTLRQLDWPVVGPIWESLVDQP